MRYFSVLVLILSACGLDHGTDNQADPGDASAGELDSAPPVEEDSRVAQYIRSATRSKLVLEVDSVPGFEPRQGAQARLITLLGDLVDKPDGIEAVADGAIDSRGADHAWTNAELFALADSTFDLDADDSTVKMHVLFVDGHSAQDENGGRILGLAWSNTHMVLFKKTINDICGGPLTPPLLREELCEATELSIWTHETGHVMGLVNAGLTMVSNHQDEEHGAHDNQQDCVMYWAYDGEEVVGRLRDRLMGGNSDALAFDDACRADIAALRDRR